MPEHAETGAKDSQDMTSETSESLDGGQQICFPISRATFSYLNPLTISMGLATR